MGIHHMRHYVPVQHGGAWHVAYANHRGELISVMECGSYGAAYAECAAMTLEATKRAICAVTPTINQPGNRYLRDIA